MKEFNFYQELTKYTKNNDTINAIIIGAMDGVSHDTIKDYVPNLNWNVAFVEPVNFYMGKLKNNFGTDERFTFIDKAISDKREEKEFLMFNTDAVKAGIINNGFAGVTTIYPAKNCMKSALHDENLNKYIDRVKFECISVSDLLDLLPFKNINYLQIDTEGYDLMILRQFDLSNIDFIKIEYSSLLPEEKDELFELFQKNNYSYFTQLEDVYAIKDNILT